MNGKQIILWDQLGRILNVLQAAKDFGSSVSGLDPVHAGLPWAGVCLLMQLVLNDSSQYSNTLSDAEEIALIISRYKQVEAIYLERNGLKLQLDFEKQLVNLYKLILKHQLALAIYYQRNTMLRLLRSVPKLDDKSDLVNVIRKADKECQAFQQLFDSEDAALRNENISDLFNQHVKLLEKMINELQNNDAKNTAILQWISSSLFDEPHNRNRNKLKDGGYLESGQWLFQNTNFQMWNSATANSPFFWIHGSVGTGKSSMICLSVEKLFKERQPGEKIAYFYCSKTEGKGSTPADIFSTLLRQLSWSIDQLSVSSVIKTDYEVSQQRTPGSTRSGLSLTDSLALIN